MSKIVFGPTLTKGSKCGRAGCKNDATTTDYRPSYIDDEGDSECIGKVLTCDECFEVENRDWIIGKED